MIFQFRTAEDRHIWEIDIKNFTWNRRSDPETIVEQGKLSAHGWLTFSMTERKPVDENGKQQLCVVGIIPMLFETSLKVWLDTGGILIEEDSFAIPNGINSYTTEIAPTSKAPALPKPEEEKENGNQSGSAETH